jgi:hypothetical protein
MPRGGQPADSHFNSHRDALEAHSSCLASPCLAPSGGRRSGRFAEQLDRPDDFRVPADQKNPKETNRYERRKHSLSVKLTDNRFTEKTNSCIAGNQRPGISTLWALPAEGPPYAKGRPA